MSSDETNRARVVPLRPAATPATGPVAPAPDRTAREPLWRHVVGGVLRRERLAQERTLKDVADAARISVPYLSELERGRKEASSEVLAAAAHALGYGLADLLALTHRELVRPARVTTVRSTTVRSAAIRSTTVRLGRPASRTARPGDVRLAA
jgi:transcriptional regulator with XRE-family HTH domain